MPRARWIPLVLALSLLPAWAAPSRQPGPLTYRGGGQGPVVFDHQLHAGRGFACRDCHTVFKPTGRQLFQTRKQGLVTLADHERPVLCFACHDGTRAFSDCGQCHRKG